MSSNTVSELTKNVRDDFIHQSRYLSKEFAALEREHIFLKVWQWACRLEEIPKVGDYVVYDVLDQSVIVVRTGKGEHDVKAFHNVCPHRGRRLLSGSGQITKFHCIFHAWQWDLEGNNTRVLDHEQWDGCEGMTSEDLALISVPTEFWEGFVFITFNENPEPFAEFLSPADECLAPMNIKDMRLCWHVVIDVAANWKVAQEAFMESYHVWGTHPQLLPFVDEKNISRARGKHAQHVYLAEIPPGIASRRLGDPKIDNDKVRTGFSGFIGALGSQLSRGDNNGQLTNRSVQAGQKALAEMSPDTPIEESIMGAVMAMKAAADEDGAFFPLITPEQRAELGEDWNIFPTMSVVMSFDGTLIFRALPNAEDPSKATIEMISLLHYGKGKEPKVEREYVDNWREQHEEHIPPLLLQDLRNMEDVQKGMKSVGLKALRPNPVQEVQISHFHKVINQYIFGE